MSVLRGFTWLSSFPIQFFAVLYIRNHLSFSSFRQWFSFCSFLISSHYFCCYLITNRLALVKWLTLWRSSCSAFSLSTSKTFSLAWYNLPCKFSVLIPSSTWILPPLGGSSWRGLKQSWIRCSWVFWSKNYSKLILGCWLVYLLKHPGLLASTVWCTFPVFHFLYKIHLL